MALIEMTAPEIHNSTKEERIAFVLDAFKCISNCETCGNCQFLRNRDTEEVYQEYIQGLKSFREVTIEYRDKAKMAQ